MHEKYGSKKIAAIAIKMALSESREEENILKDKYLELGIKTAAVDYGGEFINALKKIVERSVVAAKRENGAAREALSQIMPKAIGLNVGGKIGVARFHDHISVAVYFGIGLLHLDEVAIGLGHRAVP